jgi:hypothetical protein
VVILSGWRVRAGDGFFFHGLVLGIAETSFVCIYTPLGAVCVSDQTNGD